MKKSLVIFSIFSVTLFADTSLGTPIGNSATLLENRLLNKSIEKKRVKKPQALTPTNTLTTRITPKKVKSNFKKDNHRYDKRYRSFNYERDGYYNDDGYFYGYYDNRGYFYDNVFYAYDNQYTYYDRRNHLGYFRHSFHHHRPYIYHSFNNWNRIHCYREPNVIVYGHYYDRAYNNRYSNYSSRARMTTRDNNYHHPLSPSISHNNTFNSSHYHNNSSLYRGSRMSTRDSSSRRIHSSHRGISRMQIAR